MNSGSIDIKLGCMYSGKTSEVVKICNRWKTISNNIVCINHEDDIGRLKKDGTDTYLYTHDLNKVKCICVKALSNINLNEITNADIILINEAQFFPDLLANCVLWAETYNKKIIVSGLDGDFERKPFGQILDLIPYCNSVQKFTALCPYCKDGTEALFTGRLTDEKEQVVIGSSNYVALCRYHYNSL